MTVTGFFEKLPTGVKIFWAVLGAVFVISVIRSIVAGGQKGGIGAGIAAGLFAGVFLEDALERSAWLQKSEWYIRIPAVIAGIFVIICISAGLLTASMGLASKRKAGTGILAALLRILAVAGFTVLGFLAISKIGDAGMIAF